MPPPRRPLLRELLTLAWPIVVSRSAQVVVGIADALMVAHLGPEALAATTAGATNAFALFILPMGVVFVVASFSSQLAGAGDRAGARRYGWYGLAVAAGAALLALGVLPLAGPVLALSPYDPGVRSLMADYLVLRVLGAGAAIGLEALANYFGGLGDTVRPMRASLAAMVLNVFLNWVLIDGRLGAPALGVRGAALASTLSTSIAFLGLLALFVREGRRSAPGGPLRLRELRRLLRFGLPSGFNWFFEFLAFVFFVNVVVAGLGTVSVAAFMSVLQVNTVAFMPSFALASAGAILVGQAIGRGEPDLVPRVVGTTFLLSGGWQLSAALAYASVPGALLAPFARDPASASAFLEVGTRMLVLSAAWQLFDAAATVLAEALRAAGDTLVVLLARLTLAWLVFAPGSWITVRLAGGGELSAVAWLVLYIALLAGVLWLRFRSGAWRRIRLVEPAPG